MRQSRWIIYFAALAFLLLTLSACQTAQTDPQTDWTVEQMAIAIQESQNSQLEMTMLRPQAELYETWLTTSYGLSTEDIPDGAILTAAGTSAWEIAVLHLAETSSAELVSETLQDYLERRTGAFIGYLPDETALLEEAQIVVHGSYVALIVCEDMSAAQDAFAQCFTAPPPEPTPGGKGDEETTAPSPALPAEESEPPTVQAGVQTEEMERKPTEINESIQPVEVTTDPEPRDTQMPSGETLVPEQTLPTAESKPEEPFETAWNYDRTRLLEAWSAGDWSSLSPEDQAILNACQEVISTVVAANGSDYEKELAIHDWMIAWGSYDSNTLSNLPDFRENPNNDNPYGFLIDGKGICLGYTSTFQLFMDLLDIECISVSGSTHNGTSDHAWNQVCLDGEWYCVDVTWDDPTTNETVSEQMAHQYFNVTSSYMRDTNHQWDENVVPEASGTAYSWK